MSKYEKNTSWYPTLVKIKKTLGISQLVITEEKDKPKQKRRNFANVRKLIRGSRDPEEDM